MSAASCCFQERDATATNRRQAPPHNIRRLPTDQNPPHCSKSDCQSLRSLYRCSRAPIYFGA